MKTTAITPAEMLVAQREEVMKRNLEDQRSVTASPGGHSGLVDDRMLATSMRSIAYKDEAHAAGDPIDNSIESGAKNIHIAYKVGKGDLIEEIAIIDDGCGMWPEFLPHAVRWGGSSHQGRRNTFGRFGFGLPSSSVNRGTAFDVYSRVRDAERNPEGLFSAVHVDLKVLPSMIERGQRDWPVETPAGLPAWVVSYVTETVERDGDRQTQFPGGVDAVRTVVVWRDFDRLMWVRRAASASQFKDHLGVTYAGWLRNLSIVVDGEPVDPIDTLFTTPGCRYYDDSAQSGMVPGSPMAEPQAPIVVPMRDKDGNYHDVTFRISYLGIDARDARATSAGRGQPKKIRKTLCKTYNGMMVFRNSRFIDCVRPTGWTYQSYDEQVRIAVEFPPELDELFGISPDKQTIVLKDSVIDAMVSSGVLRARNALKRRVTEERNVRKTLADVGTSEVPDPDAARPSESTMVKISETEKKPIATPTQQTLDEGVKTRKRRIKEVSASTGLPEADIERGLEEQARKKPFEVRFKKNTIDGAYYQPYMDGTQVVLEINIDHPWFQQLYSATSVDQSELRSALELDLWARAIREIDAPDSLKAFYIKERLEWSRLLAQALLIHPEVFNELAGAELVTEFDEPLVLDQPDEE